jgi:hypothetical protein
MISGAILLMTIEYVCVTHPLPRGGTDCVQQRSLNLETKLITGRFQDFTLRLPYKTPQLNSRIARVSCG